MLMKNTLLSALWGLTLVTASPIQFQKRSWANPEACTGNCSWIHDPNIIKKDDTYYRFSTSGGIAIATATSLTGPWTYIGDVLPNGSLDKAVPNEDIWAPDVSKVGDTYYLYYAVSSMGSQNSDISYATSTSLDPGSWTDHSSMGLPKSNTYNLIDPNLFQEGDTTALCFGSYWEGIFQTDLPSGAGAYSGQVPTNLAQNTTASKAVIEGPYQFKYGDYYYLFFSSGACCNTPPNLAPAGGEYKIMVCRASQISGPYTDQAGQDCVTQNGGTLVLGSHDDVYAPGGQGVMVDDASNRPVIYYHYVKPSIGDNAYNADQFQFGYNYLDFGSGWPVIV